MLKCTCFTGYLKLVNHPNPTTYPHAAFCNKMPIRANKGACICCQFMISAQTICVIIRYNVSVLNVSASK